MDEGKKQDKQPSHLITVEPREVTPVGGLTGFEAVVDAPPTSRDDGIRLNSNNFMDHPYWGLLRMEAGGNRYVRKFAKAKVSFRTEFLRHVMLGFYPLSVIILDAFRRIVELAPTEAARAQARFFVEVEEGRHAVSDWYRNVPHAELYRRMFSSIASCDLVVLADVIEPYRRTMGVERYSLGTALVVADVIERTGLEVLRRLHDFVAQWQTLTAHPTSQTDLIYLNEHMLHEGNESDDQHVNLIGQLVQGCSQPGRAMDLSLEYRRFDVVTNQWLHGVFQEVIALLGRVESGE